MSITARTSSAGSAQARVGAERRAATERGLLLATRRLLERGEPLTRLSVERIAAEAGVSRATFYLHFPDKYGLVARLARDLFSWKDEEWVSELAEPRLRRETLERIMGRIVPLWVDNRAVLAAIIELAEYDQRMRETWRAALEDVARSAAEQFDAHWSGSPARPDDPELMAEVFTWMFERSCHQITRDGARAEDLAETMAEIIWRVLDHPGAR